MTDYARNTSSGAQEPMRVGRAVPAQGEPTPQERFAHLRRTLERGHMPIHSGNAGSFRGALRAVGFTGEARHGKDTAGAFLAEHLESRGLKVRLTAWADLLKVSAARALGFRSHESLGARPCVEFCDWLKQGGTIAVIDANGRGRAQGFAPRRLSGRQYLEWMGTEAGRDVHGQDVWIDLALPAPGTDAGRQHAETYDWHVDTTTRFPNEVDRIRAWDGFIIRVERLGVDNGLTAADHVSRTGIPREECDATIINDGTLEQFRNAVVDVWTDLADGRVMMGPIRASEYLAAGEIP